MQINIFMLQYQSYFLTNKNMQENDILNLENEINSTKNIRIWNHPTLEEKIDYIYNELKSQKRNARIKLMLKIFLIIAIYYFIVMYLPTLPQEKIEWYKKQATDFISTQVSSIATPIVQDMTNKIMKDMSSWEVKVDDNTINKVLDWQSPETKSKMEEFFKKHPELRK